MVTPSDDFTPSNMLKSYLQAKPRNMYDIRGALLGYINADPAFRTDDFDQAVAYVLRQGVSEEELYTEFVPKPKDQMGAGDQWDKAYYALANVYLRDNFSKDRIAHVKEVARKLYPHTDVSREPQSGKKEQGQQQGNGDVTQDRNGKALMVLAIIALLLAVLGIAAFLIHRRAARTIADADVAVITLQADRNG